MDVSAMYAEAGRLLNDKNNDRWSQSDLLARFNLAQTDVLVYTNSVKTRESLTPTASTAEVSLDSDVIDVIRVDIQNSDGEWKPLTGISRDQLDYEIPNWQQLDADEPIRWTWDGTNQQLILVPAPSSSWANTNGLRVWEIQKPADLSASTDVPFSSNAAMIPYHMAIVYFAVAQCWQDDGTPEALAKARYYRTNDFSRPGMYERELKKISSKFDTPEGIPVRILWKPEGGRVGQSGISKSDPI